MDVQVRYLKDLVSIKGGGTPSRDIENYWGGDVPWATVKDVKSTVISSTQESITNIGLENSTTSLIEPGAIIIPTRMGLGKVAINKVAIAINQDLKALSIRNKNEVNLEYLLRFILSKAEYLEKQGKGATVKGIKVDVLNQLKVPLPPLEDQIRIASLLSRIEGLIAKRKESIRLLDEYVKSVFLEMFGDPVRNEKGWEKKNLSTFIDKERDVSYGIVQRGNHVEGGVPVVRIRDIIHSTFIESDLVRTTIENSKKYSRTILKGGEILISIRGTIGEVAIAPPHSKGWNISREVAIIPILGLINITFLINLLKSKSIQNKFRDLVKGVAQSGMNLADLRNVEIITPPESFQMKFATTVGKVLSNRVKFKESFYELENLYGAVSKMAFRGEM